MNPIAPTPRADVPHNCTLDLIFHAGRSYTLTSYSHEPVDLAVTVIRPLYGICPTARHHNPNHEISDNPRRKVYEASAKFYGRSDNPWAPRVCVKYAVGREAVADLSHEANLHYYELRHLAGVAVPKCYSFFTGNDERKRPIACMISELCIDTNVILERYEFNRLVMLAICKVHEAGIRHNNLFDYHHFVMQGNRVFIVDFAHANAHRCGGCVPTSWNGIADAPSWCSELARAEHSFGLHA